MAMKWIGKVAGGLLGGLVLPAVSAQKTAQEINAEVNTALATFDGTYKGGARFLASSKGVLVLPNVVKAAFVFGAQYGEGELRVQNRNQGYYSITGGSWGLSFGVQTKDIIIVFRDPSALTSFEKSSGWQAGVSGTITVVTVGVGQDLSSMQFNQPIVAFQVGQKGLMVDASLQGAKISHLKPK